MTHPMLVESMLNPAFYPESPNKITLVQTHISYVFIADERVYKVKKPVNFGFLDFTSLEKRKYFCDQEVELNRRLAPQAYLDVVPICADESGRLHLGANGGQVVEYAVEMIRLPNDRMLKSLLSEKRAGYPEMEAIAAKVADFHAHAATGGAVNEMGRIETIRFNCEENFNQTEKYVGRTVSRDRYDFMRDYVQSFLAREQELLERRITDHRIRDCHGDLHLEHICLTDGIVIFDCIEFNERFRYSDIASEVAFLAMDLDYNGYPEFAEAFVSAYLTYSKDRELLKLLNFYQSYRAYVRAKVISFRLDEPALSDVARKEIHDVASRYYELAFHYAARLKAPALILVAGLMGTGKSVLSKNLASLLDAEVIRMDALRKEMLDIPPAERRYENFGEGIYSDAISREAYRRAFEAAEEKLAKGQAVIIDASFKKREERMRAREAASRHNADFFMIECVCPEHEIKRRLNRRTLNRRDPSDGRWEIFETQKRDFDEINASGKPEFPEEAHIRIDTSTSREEAAIKALRRIRLKEV